MKEHLMAPELFKEFCTEFHKELNHLRRDENAHRGARQAELATVEAAHRQVVAALADGMPSGR
jgi:hypothetical protein